MSRRQLEPAQLRGMEAGTHPQVILLLAQKVPDEDSELSRGGDRSDMLAATPSDAQEECPQRTRRPRRSPGCFHEQPPRTAGTLVCTENSDSHVLVMQSAEERL